jgi:hypothetical protein
MAITLTFETVAQLREQVTDLFPHLAASVPVAQAPTPATKEAIALQEELAAARRELAEAQSNLKKHESAYSAQGDLLRETQDQLRAAREGDGPGLSGAVEAIATACATLGTDLATPATLVALVTEVKQERDQAHAALQEAQEALEAAQLEVRRLVELVGTPNPEKKPSTRGGKKKGEAEAKDADTKPAGDGAQGFDAAGKLVEFPADFVSLPDLPHDVADGTGVIIAIQSTESPSGWLTPGGIVEKRFTGTDRYEVKLIGGGRHTVHRNAMRGVPEAPGGEAPLERAPVAPLTQAPTPAANDAVVDRLVNEDERAALVELAKKLKLAPNQEKLIEVMKALINKHFAPKTSSAELTVTEMEQLKGHMEREATIPF